MKYILLDTNAYRTLVAIDHDGKRAYCIGTVEVQTMDEIPPVDTLDVSSWDEISYDDICNELNNINLEIEILQSVNN